MVTLPKSSLLGGRAASFEPISPRHRAAAARARIVFRASLGRCWSFSAEIKFGLRLLTFYRRPKYARCPGGRRPGTDLIERSPSRDLGQKSKPLGQRLLRIRRPVTAGRSVGHWAYFGAPPITLEISRRPLADRSGIGGSSVGHCRDAARRSLSDFAQFWPKIDRRATEIDRAPPRHRWGSTACSTSPKIVGRCPNFSGDRAGY